MTTLRSLCHSPSDVRCARILIQPVDEVSDCFGLSPFNSEQPVHINFEGPSLRNVGWSVHEILITLSKRG